MPEGEISLSIMHTRNVLMRVRLERDHLYYDMHGIVKIESNVDFGFPSFFKKMKGNPTLLVKVVRDINPDLRGIRKIGLRFHYIPNTDCIYFSSSRLGLKFKLLLTDLQGKEEKTKVYVNLPYYKLMKFAHARQQLSELIEAIVSIRLLQKGLTFLHSACLSYNQQGILLPAFGDTGKTTTALSLLGYSGFHYLSDDLTIVNGDAEALCFPSPCTIHLNTYRTVRSAKIDKMELTKLIFKSLISRLDPGLFFSSCLRVDIFDLIKDVKLDKRTKVRTIYFLEKGAENMTRIDKDDAIKKLTALNLTEISWYSNPFILAYSYFNPQFDLEGLMSKEKETISKFIDNVEKCFVINSQRGRYSSIIRHAMHVDG